MHQTSGGGRRRSAGVAAVLGVAAFAADLAGQGVCEQAKLTSPDSAVSDWFGYAVSVSGDRLIVSAMLEDDPERSAGAVHVFERDGSDWQRETRLTATDAMRGAQFGLAASLDGEIAVIGAPLDDRYGTNAGAAYVFERVADSWVQTRLPIDPEERALTGYAVSASEGRLLIGSPGKSAHTGVVYVYGKKMGAWTEEALLEPPEGVVDAGFADAVSLAGDVAIVGSPSDDQAGPDAGAAYVFRRLDGVWVREATLHAIDADEDDAFGLAVAVLGDTALVGAPYEDEGGYGSGAVYVFEWDGDEWSEITKLIAFDAEASQGFGYAVQFDEADALIGAPFDGPNGAAYAYRRDGREWLPTAKLRAFDERYSANFGVSVSLADGHGVVGAWHDDEFGEDAGAAYVYLQSGKEWATQAKLASPENAKEDLLGWTSSLSGDSLLIGALFDDDNGEDAGAAFLFRDDGSEWIPDGKLTALDGTAGDLFGYSVLIRDDLAVVGAESDDDAATNAGSAYVFRRIDGEWCQEAKLLPDDLDANDEFGKDLAFADGWLAVGSVGSDPGGAVYLFTEDEGLWTLRQRCTPPDGAEAGAFGVAVGMTDDTLIVGASDADGPGGLKTGAAYIFRRLGDIWQFDVRLDQPAASPGDRFGYAIDMRDDLAVIAGDVDPEPGAAYVYRRIGDEWTFETRLSPLDEDTARHFGSEVAVDGDTIAIGARNGVDEDGVESGATYIFQLRYDGWMEEGKITPSDADEDDNFYAVALEGNTLVVGAYGDDDEGDDAGAAYVLDVEACACRADLNGDGRVRFNDIQRILSAWGNEGGPEDLDDNGIVEFPDIMYVIVNWGVCG